MSNGLTEYYKKEVVRLNKIIKVLKSELRSYDKAFRKTKQYLEARTEPLSLEDILEGVNNNETLEELEKRTRYK
jgi:hypothetical protein